MQAGACQHPNGRNKHKPQMTHALRGITNIDVYIDLPISPNYSYIFFLTLKLLWGDVFLASLQETQKLAHWMTGDPCYPSGSSRILRPMRRSCLVQYAGNQFCLPGGMSTFPSISRNKYMNQHIYIYGLVWESRIPAIISFIIYIYSCLFNIYEKLCVYIYTYN
jgi:hypothetical protein